MVVALAPEVDAPPGTRVVRTRANGSAIAAIRLGMAQLTNTVARRPARAARRGAASLVALLSLVDAAKRDEQAIVAFSSASLDESAVLLPRDAWLELVTVGESGLDAVAADVASCGSPRSPASAYGMLVAPLVDAPADSRRRRMASDRDRANERDANRRSPETGRERETRHILRRDRARADEDLRRRSPQGDANVADGGVSEELEQDSDSPATSARGASARQRKGCSKLR